jgi:hypothetical protein
MFLETCTGHDQKECYDCLDSKYCNNYCYTTNFLLGVT